MSSEGTREVEIWGKVLRTSMAMPGAKINRESYLKKRTIQALSRRHRK
jgi:hypothetical protein